MQILNISKQFGELDIVWIKKVDYSLYISLLLQMLFSSLISFGIFILLINISNYYEQKLHTKLFATQQGEIKLLVEKIQSIVEEDNLTFKEIKRKDFDNSIDYDIEFYEINDNNLAKYNYYKNRNYIFSIAFSDSDGFVVFESEEAGDFSETYTTVAGIFSLLVFFALSLRIIFNLVSYIKQIESGIKKLSDDDESYKIPVIGKNELARLAQSVNEMKDELRQKTQKERADELHQRMLITNFSHDLRTPLTSIIGYLDLAKKKIPQESEAHSYINIAEKSSLRLKKLVADLFLYSKIISEDMQMKFEEININSLIKQIIELKTHEFKFSSNQQVINLSIDIQNFHRIIDNLLDNALKYGNLEKEITLLTHKKNNKITLEVINFTNEDLSSKIEYLTRRLYTADENRKENSSGLGLSIVHELAKKMNGEFTLSFDNNTNKFIACLSFELKEKS